MQVYVGTSGYSYKEWKGPFYPAKLPASEFLSYYAGKLNTVEINNTFYRMPSEKMILAWGGKVPEDFSLVLKASRRITHSKQLQGAAEALPFLLQAASCLGTRLGPILCQFPPHFKQDVEVLAAFLDLVPADRRVALEFRHPSWFDDATYALLRERGVALVVADTDKDGDDGVEIVPTADYGYLRLRREGYDRPTLESWARNVARQPWEQAHVFFKHEDKGVGPKLALEFNQCLEAARS